MASIKEKMNTVKADTNSTWSWVDNLVNGADVFSSNAEKITSSVDKIGSVIGSIFGGKEENSAKVESGFNWTDYLPLVLAGGLIAMIF